MTDLSNTSHSPGPVSFLNRVFGFAPTPALSVAVLILTGFEFWQSLGRMPAPWSFYGLILVMHFLILFVGVWALWLVTYKLVTFPRTRAVRIAVFSAVATTIWAIIALYSVAWITRLYTGTFPDFYSARMVLGANGIRYALHIVNASTPWVLHGAAVAGCVTMIGVPWFTWSSIMRTFARGTAAHEPTAKAWLVSVFSAGILFLGIYLSGHDLGKQMAQTRYLTSGTSPVIAFAHSLYEVAAYKDVPPEISKTVLVPYPKTPAQVDGPVTSATTNILFLAAEAFRADLLHAKVNGIEVTPNLNALARESIEFTNAYSQGTHTDYALPALLSSLYPLRMEKHHYYRRTDPWDKYLVYDHLAELGYANAIITSDDSAWGSKGEYFWSKSLEVYFDSRNMPDSLSENNVGYMSGADLFSGSAVAISDLKTLKIAKEWITRQSQKSKPWFLHTMFQFTHFPYNQNKGYPAPFQPTDMAGANHTFFTCPPEFLPNLKNIYYNAAHATDIELGRLLDHLKTTGMYDKTAIIFVGDHGEAFGEHGRVTHAGPNIQEQTRVPLLIKVPNQIPRIEDYPTQLIDIIPTFYNLIEMEVEPGWQGIDVLSKSRPPLEKRALFFHTNMPPYYQEDAILYAGKWKYRINRQTNQEMLFNIKQDPKESLNIIHKHSRLSRNLRLQLEQWRQNQLAYYSYVMFYNQYLPPAPPLLIHADF